MADNKIETPMKRTVLDYDDIVKVVPMLQGKKRLVERLLHWLSMDKVNWLHEHNCDTPGYEFTNGLLRDLEITLQVDNAQVLDNLPEGAFITVSNHPFGALDGIALINIVGAHRPQFKVMVNMVLNQIAAMRPNFIAVDAWSSSDPKKKAVSMNGLKQAIMHVRSGEPIGFFPAGAMSKWNRHLWLEDRPWQANIIRLIKQLKVPVMPIFFQGTNSFLFNFLGVTLWQLRTLRLPSEVFRKKGSTMHITVGDPITVEQQLAHADTVEELGKFLKDKTYALRQCK